MEKMYPMLFTTWKTYSKEQFLKDLIAGIVVAIIALPLSIALALASGVGPEQGIYTAIVAGFIISFLGGSQVQIAGPTAAFATIVAGIVARNGMDGLAAATILAGIILIIMGLCRFGGLIKYIPFTITTGFTSGIAIVIALGQIDNFFGTHSEAESLLSRHPYIQYRLSDRGPRMPGYSYHRTPVYGKNPRLSSCRHRRHSHGAASPPSGQYHRRSLHHKQ